MIAYCFAEKKGYSKFGSYKGNGSSDGTNVILGFKPAVLIYKNTSQSDDFSVHTAAGGYINTTSAIDEIRFKFDSGNIDLGSIRMYGVR